MPSVLPSIVPRRAASLHESVLRFDESSFGEKPWAPLFLATLPTTMIEHIIFTFLFLLRLSLLARGSALTTAIAANERLCFYADVDKAGEKIGVRAN